MSTVYVLQHIRWEPAGAIETALAAAGVAVRYVRSGEGEPVPAELDDAAGLVVMGGPMGVYEQDRYPYLTRELQLIEHTVAQGKPVLGVCLGSQLLAAALGATVRPGHRKEVGWHPVSLAEVARNDALLAGVPPSFTPLHWHGDVFDLPPGAVRLASSALTETQAFRFGRSAYGFLFHLEVTPAIVRDWATHFTADLEEVGSDADALLRGARANLPALEGLGAQVYGRWARLLG